jgi:excisionase family DNA binding protein
MVTIQEIVRRAKVGRRTVERAIQRGDLRAVRVGTRVLVKVEDATSWLTRTPVKVAVPVVPDEAGGDAA